MVGKIAISVVSVLLVVGIIVGVVVMVNSNGDSDSKQPHRMPSMKMVTSICELTNYKQACAGSLESVAKNDTASANDYILAVVVATLNEVKKSSEATSKVVVDKAIDELNHVAIQDCKDFFDYAVDKLEDSISLVSGSNMQNLEERAHELLSWMTAVYAFHTTCLDQIQNPDYKSAIQNGTLNSTQLSHNAVNIVAELPQILKLFNYHPTLEQNITAEAVASAATSHHHRRRLMSDGYPTWFGPAERKLLARPRAIVPNAVVAKDGSGRFKSISAAIAACPDNNKGRFIIYVKAGIYQEQVIIKKKKTNIFIYGDGIGRTIVTGRRNFGIMKIGTMHTATFANEAAGFIARGITFSNEAGPQGHQAVAFRSVGDKAAMFDCSFEGHQDTLYYQFLRQFYRNCRIYGTIDFIFGKGDAVIQDSEIVVRRPLPKQFNTVTADGREIPRGSNGLVIHNCRIIPDKFLYPIRFQVPTYLGRPWTREALTVVMQSELGDFIRPEGWKLWDGSQNHRSCEMYEFGNRGPGARTDRRNKEFARFKVIGPNQAAKYTPGLFLAAGQWLPQTGVPFRLGF
ncbi:Pectinesterase 4 [Sesamum alatum]|uniref:Pectinesterase n=1 Tax=Sesamum alatum TaxID=300844 RepID=A0AAE1XU45_9LAMI|nr:Pectinesterase 4 [Sesamum alatum]